MNIFDPMQADQILEGMERDGIAVPPVSVVIAERTLNALVRNVRSPEATTGIFAVTASLVPGRQGLAKVYRGRVSATGAAAIAVLCEVVIPLMPAGLDRGAVKSDRDLLCKELTRSLMSAALSSGMAA